MIIEHLAEFTGTAWAMSHPMYCGDPLACTLNQAFRALTKPPKVGRFWAAALIVRGTYVLDLGASVPPDVMGNSRRTAGGYAVPAQRPGRGHDLDDDDDLAETEVYR